MRATVRSMISRLLSLAVLLILSFSPVHAEPAQGYAQQGWRKQPKPNLEVKDSGAQLGVLGRGANDRQRGPKDLNDYAREDSQRVVVDPTQVQRQLEKERKERFPNVKEDQPLTASYD